MESLEVELHATNYAPPGSPLLLWSFVPATQCGFLSAAPGYPGRLAFDVVLATVIAFNLLGDALRDALDPTLGQA